MHPVTRSVVRWDVVPVLEIITRPTLLPGSQLPLTAHHIFSWLGPTPSVEPPQNKHGNTTKWGLLMQLVSKLTAWPNTYLHQHRWRAHYRAGKSCMVWEQLILCCHMILCNANPQTLFTPTENKADHMILQKRPSLCIGRSHIVHHGFEIWI